MYSNHCLWLKLATLRYCELVLLLTWRGANRKNRRGSAIQHLADHSQQVADRKGRAIQGAAVSLATASATFEGALADNHSDSDSEDCQSCKAVGVMAHCPSYQDDLQVAFTILA